MISGRLVCAAAMVATMAVAGCGSGKSSSSTTKIDFKTGFATSQRDFRKLGSDLAKDIIGARSKTDAQLAKEFRALATRAGQQAGQLAALKPPAEYAKRITSLVASFNATKADLTNISTAATTHNPSNAEAATRDLLSDAAKIKRADTSLSKELGLPPAEGAPSSSASKTHTTG